MKKPKVPIPPPVPLGMEHWVSGSGQVVTVHAHYRCNGPICAIHNPAISHMDHFPTHWDHKSRAVVRICPHKAYHPDPSHVASIRAFLGPVEADEATRHACCDNHCCVDDTDDD